MTAGLDCGPVFECEALAIGETETAGELHDRLEAAGGELLAKHLDKILGGELDACEQDEDKATYAPKIKNADARLEWELPAGQLERAVRAFNPAGESAGAQVQITIEIALGAEAWHLYR